MGWNTAVMRGLHHLKSQLTKQKEDSIINIEKGAAGKRLAPHSCFEVIAELSRGRRLLRFSLKNQAYDADNDKTELEQL